MDVSGEKKRLIDERMNDPGATTLEKALAAIAGAAEGFGEEAHKTQLPALVAEAFEKTAEVFRETSGALAPTEPTGTGLDAGTATRGGGAVAEGLEKAATRLREGRPRFEATVEKARDVASRAAMAPARIRAETTVHAKAVAREVATTLGGAVLALVAVGLALALFSAAAAFALNAQYGAPRGSLVVAVFWTLVAIIAILVARSRIQEAKREAREGAEAVRNEVRDVARPLRGQRA